MKKNEGMSSGFDTTKRNDVGSISFCYYNKKHTLVYCVPSSRMGETSASSISDIL